MYYLTHYSRRILTPIVFTVLVAAVLSSCSNTAGTSSDQAAMDLRSAFSSDRVYSGTIGSAGKSAPTDEYGMIVDSLEVTSARIVIRDIKLHHEENDSIRDDRDETVRTGPFVVVYDSSGERLVSTATIAPGTYDRIKFEIHKYDSEQDDHFEMDQDDSAKLFTAPDPYTFVISGYVWNGGVRSPFTYYSKATANVTWKLEPPITLAAGSEHALLLKLDPVFMFRVIGLALDPRDPANRHLIDLALKTAITVWSKF